MIRNNILINTETRKIKKQDYDFLGVAGENEIEQLVFTLTAFIDGIGIIEIQKNNDKYFIELEKQEESYVLDIKNSLLSDATEISMQLHITQNEKVFKSEIFMMEIRDQIHATETIPEEYPEWIDTANAKIQEMLELEESIEEYINDLKEDVENGELDGATFTPSVDSEGNISWSNNKGLPNPQTQNIRGPEGPQGLPGANGKDGQDGKDGIDGHDGNNGQDGHTPVKGIDYFTQNEINEFTTTITNNVNANIGLILDQINGEVV